MRRQRRQRWRWRWRRRRRIYEPRRLRQGDPDRCVESAGKIRVSVRRMQRRFLSAFVFHPPAFVPDARNVGGTEGVGTSTCKVVSPQWGGRPAWAIAARERRGYRRARVVHGQRGGADRHFAGAAGQTRGWCGADAEVSAFRVGAEVVLENRAKSRGN